MCQKCDHKVKHPRLKRDGHHGRVNATNLQLLGARNSLTAAHKRLEQRSGWSPASQLRIELLLSSSVSHFISGATTLVHVEVAAHLARTTSVVASALESLELDLRSLVELLITV